MKLHTLLLTTLSTLALTTAVNASTPANSYTQENFVANDAKYNPTLEVDKGMINGWGIAIRPAGAGGHFWIAAKDISYEYVGDVKKSSDPKLQKLHKDDLTTVKLPVGGDEAFATGMVFVDSKDNFIITQKIKGAEPITAPAKFIFASDGGIISAWTERKKEDGTFDRSPVAETVIDASKDGAQFFGLATNKSYNRLYAADFGKKPQIRVYNGKFQPEAIAFDQPFDTNGNKQVDAGEYAPFNIQGLTTPAGDYRLFVTYAKTQACPEEEVAKGTCAKGALFVGEEDTAQPGSGRLAEFDENGKLIATWNDGGHLSAPWGLAFAPKDFGALSGSLLVANFGDGTIAAYDPKTKTFLDYLRNDKSNAAKIDKIWGLTFGNGASLGDSNALYFTAGPNDEKDGVFGSLRVKE